MEKHARFIFDTLHPGAPEAAKALTSEMRAAGLDASFSFSTASAFMSLADTEVWEARARQVGGVLRAVQVRDAYLAG